MPTHDTVPGHQPRTASTLDQPPGPPPADPNSPSLPSDQSGHTPINFRPGTGLRMFLFALFFLLLLAAGFFYVNHRRNRAEHDLRTQTLEAGDAPMSVDVVKIKFRPDSRVIPLPGECRAWYETTIYARVNGYVKDSFVDIGDHVKAGQILATIETPELDQQLASSLAKVETYKADVKVAEASVHFSQVTLARFKDAPKGIVSDLERDEKEADYQTSQAKLTAAQSDLHASQAQVDQLHAMIAFQKVTAPFDGIITQRHVDIGDLVTAGSTANTTPLFALAQSDEMRVFVNVPETLAPEIHDGAQAVATADEFPGRQFLGKIARTSHAINNTAKTLRVEVDIPNQPAVLLPGMFVKVNFELNGLKPRLIIPASAINFRTGGPQVATVSNDGHVTFHNVTIARDLGNVIEISGGLQPGDRVALNISYQIADGDVVKPNEVVLPDTTAPAPKSPAQADAPAEPKRVSLDAR